MSFFNKSALVKTYRKVITVCLFYAIKQFTYTHQTFNIWRNIEGKAYNRMGNIMMCILIVRLWGLTGLASSYAMMKAYKHGKRWKANVYRSRMQFIWDVSTWTAICNNGSASRHHLCWLHLTLFWRRLIWCTNTHTYIYIYIYVDKMCFRYTYT